MQVNKPSKKTSKAAEKKAAPASKKKSEIGEMASVSHHHKATSVAPIDDAPRRAVHPNQIAELAYSYWEERGFAHGSHEDDWLRAEQALGLR